MVDRIIKCCIEMEIVEGVHIPHNSIATEEQIVKEAEDRFLYYVKDYIAGGEIKEYMQTKVLHEQG